MQNIPPKAQTIHHARTVALHEHVGRVDDAQQQLTPEIGFQVEGDAALVAVDGVEKRALPIDHRWSRAHVIAAAGLFDLDHIGAHVGQEEGAVSAWQKPRQVEDTGPFKWHRVTNSGFAHTLVGDFR